MERSANQAVQGENQERSSRLEELEMTLLLEGLYQYYGDDFRGSERHAVLRRVKEFLRLHHLPSISALQECALHDQEMGAALRCSLHVRPTALFSFPDQLAALRTLLRPWLRSCAMPKVWVADTTTAEEIFTVAILLADEGFYDTTLLFATGPDERLLSEARKGSFAAERLAEYEANYRRSGGVAALADYLVQRGDRYEFVPRLGANIIWAQSDLSTDTSFNEFQLIVCRKTLAEFGLPLRRRTLAVFGDSMAPFGVLCVGPADQVGRMDFGEHFKATDQRHGLYRRNA
jgi:chemotaxis protein methyltransferase CheR